MVYEIYQTKNKNKAILHEDISDAESINREIPPFPSLREIPQRPSIPYDSEHFEQESSPIFELGVTMVRLIYLKVLSHLILVKNITFVFFLTSVKVY